MFGAAGHSPNHSALATRKLCQNDEFSDIRPAFVGSPPVLRFERRGDPEKPGQSQVWPKLTSPKPNHICARSCQWR